MLRARFAVALLASLGPACDAADAEGPRSVSSARATAQASSHPSRTPRSVIRRIVARKLGVSVAAIDDGASLTSIQPAADDTHVVEIVSAVETELSVTVPEHALERLAGGHHSLASTLSVDELVRIVESSSD